MSTEKRRFGDRRDGKLLRDIDGMHLIMPMIYPNRCDNEAFISERIDLTNIDKYIAEYNAKDPEFKLTLFHIIVASVMKLLVLRPKLNRFIVNKNLYQRNNYSASFIVKKQFSDSSEEGMAFIYANEDSTLDSLHDELYKQIKREKSASSANSTADTLDFFTTIPRFLVKIIIWLLCRLDRHGIVPQDLIAADPYYASVIFSNLGSIKLKSGYHHLTNWGTTSIFVVVGEMKKRVFLSEDGTEEYRNSVDLGLTIDERLADGYYYSKSVRILKHILEHPECLEQPFSTPVEFD